MTSMATAPSVQIQVPAEPMPGAAAKDGARKAAEDFEAVFINELLSHMDQGLSTGGPFTGGQSEGVYRGLLDDAVSKEIAKRGGIGLADNIYHEILKLQEAKQGQAKQVQAAQTDPAQSLYPSQNKAKAAP